MHNNMVKPRRDTQAIGRAGEQQALSYLLAQGLVLMETNYRRPYGEIDLIMQHGSTVVFVEVRLRRHSDYGSAADSIGVRKQQRLRRAAQTYLKRYARMPPCRFDVIAIDGGKLSWLRNVMG